MLFEKVLKFIPRYFVIGVLVSVFNNSFYTWIELSYRISILIYSILGGLSYLT